MNKFQQEVLERLDKIISLLETKQSNTNRRLTEDKQLYIDRKYPHNPYSLPYPFYCDPYNLPYWYGGANSPKDIYGSPVSYCSSTLNDASNFSSTLSGPSTSSSLAFGSTATDSNLSDSFFTINTK